MVEFILLDQIIPWMTYLGSHFAVIFFIILNWVQQNNEEFSLALILLYAIQ